jgi:hypothetical protein
LTIYATLQVCDASLPDLIIKPHPDSFVGVTISSKDGQTVTLGWAVLEAMLAAKPKAETTAVGWAVLEAMLAAKPKAETTAVVAGVQEPEAVRPVGNGQVAAGGKT